MGQFARIAHYEVERELGRGAMGIVYLAKDLKLGRPVAIKSLPEELATDMVRRVRFENEAKTLAAVNHPNIGAIYGVEEAHGHLFLILELAEGPTLGELISQKDLPIEETLELCRQVALGIDAAHARGIVHRDLKPANIKVRPDGVVKVLDFGIAMAGDVQSDQPASADQPTIIQTAMTNSRTTGMVVGTPGYMSPEQARGRPISNATDVWALACVMYECLTRRVAFAGDTVADALATTLMSEPDYAILPPRTPGRVLALLRKCLEKDPRQRIITMASVAEELKAASQDSRTGRGTRAAGMLRGRDAWPPSRGRIAEPTSVLTGRDREFTEGCALLNGARALTLLGPGGSGKSALAAAIAHAASYGTESGFDAGAWLVSTPHVRDVQCLPFVVATSLRITPAQDSAGAIAESIGNTSALIVIDGGEANAASVSSLALRLLDDCPRLKVISTARAPLGLPGESALPVGGLAAPSSTQARAAGVRLEAGRVFIDAASRASQGFQATAATASSIADLCRFVGGWPLAVSILGGMAGTMEVKEIHERLEQRALMLGSRVSDVLPVDMANTLVCGWAIDQLPPGELALLFQAAIHASPPTIRQIVAAGGARDSLPVASNEDPVGGFITVRESRVLSMLPKLESRKMIRLEGSLEDPLTARVVVPFPVRRAALERLKDTPAAELAVRAGHRAYCLASLEQALQHASGPAISAWATRLDREYPEFLWALEHSGLDDFGKRISELAGAYAKARSME